LELKPGSTGSIMVVVSNRLGRPVMGLVEGAMTPPTVASWLVPPPPDKTQRRYEADPSATANLEFKVVVPADAVAQDVQFKATVRDVLAPDDTKVEGQTVAIKVTRDPVIIDDGKKKIPWWVWVIVGVVVVGAGVGIFLAVRPKGMPDVVGKTEAEARTTLTEAGYAPITVVDSLIADSLIAESEDTGTVGRQDPVAGSELPVDTMVGKSPATIVVTREETEVPDIVNRPLALALDRLREAGLKVIGDPTGRYTGDVALDDHIAQVNPPADSTVARGSGVTLAIFAYSPTPPPTCPPKCVVGPKIDWNTEVEAREMKVHQPGMTRQP
jgi:hypothetical protein